MKIVIKTQVNVDRYLIQVIKDGAVVDVVPATPGSVVKVRDKVYDRWCGVREVELIHMLPIPPIPTNRTPEESAALRGRR